VTVGIRTPLQIGVILIIGRPVTRVPDLLNYVKCLGLEEEEYQASEEKVGKPKIGNLFWIQHT